MIASLLAASIGAAQSSANTGTRELEPHWEIGALGGFGWTNDLTVKSPAGSATTGLKSGAAIGAFGGDDMYDHFSGEARYIYRYNDLKLESGSTKVAFGAHTHIAEGAFLFHFRPRQSNVRPYIAFGGGVKVLQGTGIESAGQPLGRFAALTATREVLPTADAGLGVKFNIGSHARLRVEVRDYISSTPSKVIAPVPGASLNGVMNDLTGFVGLGYMW